MSERTKPDGSSGSAYRRSRSTWETVTSSMLPVPRARRSGAATIVSAEAVHRCGVTTAPENGTSVKPVVRWKSRPTLLPSANVADAPSIAARDEKSSLASGPLPSRLAPLATNSHRPLLTPASTSPRRHPLPPPSAVTESRSPAAWRGNSCTTPPIASPP